jgi:P2 family phage major capsid protein
MLSENGKLKLRLLFENTAKAYGGRIGEQFAATPTIEQTLIEKIIEHGNAFMPYFTMLMVNEIKGEKVLMSPSGRSASRTDTTTYPSAKRTPRSLLSTSAKGYELFQTNNDVYLRYNDIDIWSKFPNFQAMYNAIVKKDMADSIVRVGWNGLSAAATTDIATYPGLDDVNIGWLQIMRAFGSGSNYSIGTTGVPIELGGGSYANLDALVNDFKFTIPRYFRDNLIVYISDDLLAASEGVYYEANEDKAAEKILVAQNKGTVLNTFGGLPAVVPPFFPDGTVLIAPRDALYHYTQSGSVRRTLRDEPDGDRVADYNSSNQGYVVAMEEACYLIENITIAS